ncbi:MAG: hypothetical protein SFW36_11420 [Leptolyngbyaceae cyanobacterium bins.59]|nr:hypothetical protein [Leptolyngbyaceae cyanobacterium bins.59]
MSSQLHTQKNTPGSTPASPNHSFQPRPFVVQAKEDALDDEQAQPDFQMDLDRAGQFGHSLNHIQVQPTATPAAPIQSKSIAAGIVSPIQREEEGEEEGQMKAESAPKVQLQEEGEEESQMKAEEAPPIQQSQQPVQFFIMMLLPMIMKMVQPMLQPLLQNLIGGLLGGGGGGGGGDGGGGGGE